MLVSKHGRNVGETNSRETFVFQKRFVSLQASILWPPAASALANSGHLPLAQRQNMCSPPVQVAQNLGWMANVPSDKYVDHRGCQAPQ